MQNRNRDQNDGDQEKQPQQILEKRIHGN